MEETAYLKESRTLSCEPCLSSYVVANVVARQPLKRTAVGVAHGVV